MALGKNIVEIVLRLLDQASAPFRKAAKEVSQGSTEMAKGHQHAAKAADQASESLKGAGQQSQQTGNEHEKHKHKTHELEMGYMLLAAAITTAYVAMTAAVVKGIEAHNREVAAFTGLRSTVIGTGQDYERAAGFVKSFTEDGLVAQANAATALKNLLSRGFSLDEAIDMLNRFKDSAAFGRQASLSMGEAVKSATEGIKNENSILVDNAGVTKNVSVMWKEYAAQIGKSVDKLTLAEKRQAEYNGIMQETRHQVGDAAKLANELGGQLSKAGQATEMAAAALGRAWAPAVALGAKILTGMMNLLREAADRFPVLTFVVTALATAVVGMTAAWIGWLAVQGPIMAAMTAIAAKAGVMWAAVTGPVGLVIAGITAVAVALYSLVAAQKRAAEAAVQSARQQEQAAREAAEAARNRVRETVRQEADLQNQVMALQKQAAEKRSAIARQEIEERRQQANRFGELILSALKQKHSDEQAQEERALSDRMAALKDHYRDELDIAKQATADQVDQLREQLDAEKDAIKTAMDERREALRRQRDQDLEALDERRQALQDQQRDELDQTRAHYDALADASKRSRDRQLDDLRDWASQQERIIRDTYAEQLALLDAEAAAEIGAVQDQIDAIDQLTRQEEKAERQRRREQRITELEAKALTATSAAERTRLLEEAANLRAEAEREVLLEARDAQKDALREQIEQIRRHAEERREAIRQQQADELEQLRETVEVKRQLLEEQHQRELEQLKAQEKEAIASLERLFKAQLQAMAAEKKALDAKLQDGLKLLDQEERAQLESADRTFKEKEKVLQAALEAQKQHTEDLLAEVDRQTEAEKAKIHDKYHGENGLLNEARVYAEALKMVHDNNQTEILALLDKYEPDWRNQGKDFVQRLAEGGWDEKPKVDALGEAIGLVMQAAAENVIMLGQAADDGAQELAEINAQLDHAKTSLSEIQAVRQQAEAEADAAERAAAQAEYNRIRLEEHQKAMQQLTDPRNSYAGQTDPVTPTGGDASPAAPPSIPFGDYANAWKNAAGSRHGGGPVPFSGAYRLLQGEHVLSRAEAQQYQQAPRLVEAGALIGESMWSAGGAPVGLPPINFDFRGAQITSQQDAERFIRQASRSLLDIVRQNTSPVR